MPGGRMRRVRLRRKQVRCQETETDGEEHRRGRGRGLAEELRWRVGVHRLVGAHDRGGTDQTTPQRQAATTRCGDDRDECHDDERRNGATGRRVGQLGGTQPEAEPGEEEAREEAGHLSPGGSVWDEPENTTECRAEKGDVLEVETERAAQPDDDRREDGETQTCDQASDHVHLTVKAPASVGGCKLPVSMSVVAGPGVRKRTRTPAVAKP